DYSGGRFNLGLASGAADFLGWVGLAHDRPLTSLKEVIDVLGRLFAGEPAALDGHFLQWQKEAYLRFEVKRHVPMYIGAMSPNMLRAIGEVADGGLPLLFPPEHYAAVTPYINEGIAKSGRRAEDVDVAACIWVSVAEDRAEAEAPLREKIAYYGHAFSDMILGDLGLSKTDFEPIEHAIMAENDAQKAMNMITPQMLKIGIAGTPHNIIERIEGLVDMGAQHISFGPPLGPDPLAAVQQIGATVIPHFKR
ncbi:MAG: LLM class flavin-dependent oxidoreductase, partial [Chloroflexota bacterium]